MSHAVTDRKHLAKVVQKILAGVHDLQEAWLDEDRDANIPRRTDTVPVSGGSTSDPTFQVVTDDTRHIGRDQIGRTLLAVARRVDDELARQRPSQPGKQRCHNCQWAASTHGVRCEACDRWKRRHRGEERPRQVFEAHRDKLQEAS